MNVEYLLIIDTGTTNTRVTLLGKDKTSIATARRDVGVRNTAIDGSADRLKEAVKSALEEALSEAKLNYEQIGRVIASGMISSNVGLVEIPHLTAPAGAKELANAVCPILLPEVCPLPIHFIPGIKNHSNEVTLQNFESMDIMRGEEVESIGLIDRYHKGRPMLLVLPGSHNKFVMVDAERKISGCLTSISGELLSSITDNTIIADAVGRSFVGESDYDREMLITGYKCAAATGLARACFSGRILNQFALNDKKKIANYILGAVLQGDIFAAKNSSTLRVDENTDVIVAGKNPLRRAIADVLKYDGSFKNITEHSEESSLSLSALGVCIISDTLGI